MATKIPPRRGLKRTKIKPRNGTHSGPAGKAKVLTPEQFDRAQEKALEVSEFGTRDRLLIMLTRYCGLRAKEAASIWVEDLTDAEGNYNGVLHITKRGAKYGKERTLPLRKELQEGLEAYIKEAGIESGPIFWSYRGEPLTSNAVQKQIKAIYVACGFKGARSHSGRRSAITLMSQRANTVDASLEDVRIWAGHANISTTATYVDQSPRANELVKLL